MSGTPTVAEMLRRDARRRRIALLTSARSWRGSGSVFATIGAALAARGDLVTGLVAHEAVAAGFRASGLAARILPTGHTTLAAVRALRWSFRELDTDVVFADKPRDVRLAAFASLGTQAALVYCISTPLPANDALTRLAFRRVRLTIFLGSEHASRAFLEAPFMRRRPHTIIPNGVDCEIFRPNPGAANAFRQLNGLGDGPILVGVGALVAEKRWDFLLESVAALPPPRPPLVLCGVGPLAEPLRTIALRLQLDLRLVGTLQQSQLVGAYNAATCVVHSGPEVCSLALIEALACGRPVLATDRGGNRELLGDAGVLVPPGDTRAFAQVLRALLEDHGSRDRLGAVARERAVERFALERMKRAYADVVETLAPKPPNEPSPKTVAGRSPFRP